jgi:hypothetical protein
MERKDRIVLAMVIGMLGFVITYYFQPFAFYYYPLEGIWSTEKLSETIAMGWYGRSFWGLTLGALAGSIAFGLLGKGWKILRFDAAIKLLSLLAVTALVLLSVHIVIHEFSVG